jgi:predicted nucleic acid-binding protein
MIATICSWHEHHERAVREIEVRLKRKEQMSVAAHSLAESYSVLTRLPAPHRIAPAEAMTLLESNFIRSVKVVALPSSAYVSLLRAAPQTDVSGGRTYDAIIAACARRVRARTLLTFNEQHFALFSSSGLEIIVP